MCISGELRASLWASLALLRIDCQSPCGMRRDAFAASFHTTADEVASPSSPLCCRRLLRHSATVTRTPSRPRDRRVTSAGVTAPRSKGRIVNFASLQSSRAFPDGIAYGASKGGVAQMTRAMAEAWSADGINANALGPGFFPTELTAPVFDDAERRARNAAQTCIGRNGRLEDINGPLLFLCSPASDYVTGIVLMVDGGFTAK